jgi:predicted DNA-binding transcriptional regulator YafY
MFKGKNQLERILEIDNKIRKGGFPDKKSFADCFEVSNKSIERDFEYMRDRLNAPLAYDKCKRGYYYTDNSYFLPGDMMSDSEIFTLLMSQQIVGSLGDSPIKDKLEATCKGLSKYLPDELKNEFDLSLSHFTIISEPTVIIDGDQWKLILRSVRENRRLIFDYKKSAGQDEYSSRELSPYHIVSWQGSWYVIGLNLYTEKIETFAISRMKKLKVGQSFPFPKEFDVNEFVDFELGLYIDSDMYQIAVRFKNWCAPYIHERKWHRTQSIEELDDGCIVLRFNTNQLETTRQWVLRWGNGAVVIEPPELVEKMRRSVREMAEDYENL